MENITSSDLVSSQSMQEERDEDKLRASQLGGLAKKKPKTFWGRFSSQWMQKERDEDKLRASQLGGLAKKKPKTFWGSVSSQWMRKERDEDKLRASQLGGLANDDPESSTLVGRRDVLSQIRQLLPNERIIWICGMSGIGKTALMEAAAASVAGEYDRVIWVNIECSWDANKIQEVVQSHLPPSFESQNEKMLLVLDGVQSVNDWQLDYLNYLFNKLFVLVVYIARFLPPLLDASYLKKLFSMVIELRFLDVESSWELFRRKLGGDVDLDHPSIRPLAETVVAKCGGLPLALIKVAKAMEHATTALQWEHAIRTLDEFPGLLPGIEGFLSNLKSEHFDRLKSKTAKQCLIYCSLFPEDHSISEDQLRELIWVTEGLNVDRDDPNSDSDYEISHIKGDLVDNCLLILDGCGRWKMHNVVRMMIHWLIRGAGRHHRQSDSRGPAEEEFEVTDQADMWRDVHRLHLLLDRSGVLRQGPGDMPADESFRHPLYLMLRNRELSYSFLRNSLVRTPAMQFLDLSDANVVGGRELLLPPEVGLLVGLRHLNLSGTATEQLPREIESLANLEYLDLSRTGIKELPAALGKLTRLRHLLLRETRSLSSVPEGTIESLKQLRTLDFFRSSFRSINWLDLALSLRALERVGMSLVAEELEALYDRRRWFVRKIRSVELSQLGGLTGEQLSDYFPQLGGLRELDIVGPCCSESQQLELTRLPCSLRNLRLSCLRQTKIDVGRLSNAVDLRELRIDRCHGLRDFRVAQPQLRYVGFADCSGLEELLLDDGLSHCLKKMSLRCLPRLRIISGQFFNRDSFVELEVRGCPELKTLPFEGVAASTVRVVGEQEWWDKLEFPWDTDGLTKAAFGLHPFNPAAANASGSPSVEQGKEEHHDGVGSLKKKGKEKLEEIESFRLEEDREVLISGKARSEETDLTTRPELIISFTAASGGGTEKSCEGEASSLNEQDRDNYQDDKAVIEILEEEGTDSGSRQEGSLRLQLGKESISQVECSKQTAQEAMGDGEKHQSITDGLIDAESHKEIVSKIRECLQADEIRVIGIHGTGGAGKTTLLKMINAEFCSKQNSHFDVVIMVTSLKHYQHKKRVQREIGEQLGLSLLASGPSFLDNLQDSILRQALSQTKFLLILDGVQEMDWDRIASPLLNKKSKIIFSTDGFMPDGFKCMENVEVVNMNGLSESESWELFLRNVKDEAVCEDESIKHLAKQVVAKCDGLPLALILVGRALADKKTTKDWQDALHKMVLLTKEHESGEHFGVQYSLKFSYDYLKNDTLRLCLLYCSLFPENHRISIEELIKYWFGEGLLHDIDIDTAYTTGHTVINELKAAFLLEDGNDKEREVKMHDVVREFALQLTSGANKQSDMFLVHSGVGLSNVPDVEKWKNATRISLMHNEIELFPSKIPRCSNLSTLLVNRNISLKQMPKDFLKHMPALCVLDLSCTGIEELPRSIGSLSKLQFLSLSNTYIKTIPKEVGKLVQLRQLDMSSMSGLSDIPQKAISTLSKLQSLNLYNTGQWLIQQPGHNKPKKACIEDLKLLHQLKDLKLTINSLISLQELQNIPSLCRRVKTLSLQQVDGLTSDDLSVILGELERLQVLQVSELSQLKEICFTSHQLQSLEVFSVEHLPQVTFTVAESSDYFFLRNLRHLQIVGCHEFKDLEWIHQLGTLQYLELRICYGIEEIQTATEVEEEVIKDCSFQKLQTLLLWDLPRLQRISSSSLFLPSLERLEVFHCPKLKELPLTVKSARKLKNIHGHQEWWDGLEWEDQSVKLTLLPHFKDPRNHKEVGDQLGLMGSNH